MRAFGVALVVVFANMMSVAPAQGQSLASELDLTVGYSSDDSVKAVATQLRAFGDVKAGIRFNIEGTWAQRSDDDTDAFGAAYPYSGRVQVSEAYAERTFQRGSALAGIRLGRYRTPFGIYSRSDHAYSGFLRAPLIRYDEYWALTNNFLEHGADVIVGTPRLSVEASIGVPGDIGISRRRSGLDSVVRAQGYYRAFIVGVSYINSEPYGPVSYARGRLEFTGVDARWTLDGVQLRGEWIAGQPWTGPKTSGGYLDAIVHRPFMGPVTAVFRSEQLNYASKFPFSWHGEDGYTDWQGRRQTMGGRVRMPGGFTAQVNVILQTDELAEYAGAGLDVGLTYSIRRQ
jgi:hypothetical protein